MPLAQRRAPPLRPTIPLPPVGARAPARPVYLSLAEARGDDAPQDGDVLLFRRGRGVVSYLIGQIGRSIYSHVGLAARWGDDWMCLETREWQGGRAVQLARYVAAAPGTIDLFRLCPEQRRRFQPDRAVAYMRDVAGRPYGWASVLWVGLRRLALVRPFVPPDIQDEANGRHPFCSMAVSRAYREGGIDLVPLLADRTTEPGDLARSAALQYYGTLIS